MLKEAKHHCNTVGSTRTKGLQGRKIALEVKKIEVKDQR